MRLKFKRNDDFNDHKDALRYKSPTDTEQQFLLDSILKLPLSIRRPDQPLPDSPKEEIDLVLEESLLKKESEFTFT